MQVTPEVLAAVAGILGALLGIFKFFQWMHRNVSPKIRHAFKRYVDVCDLEDSLAAIQGANDELLVGLRQLLDEVRPNGGSSLRDAINRIEHRQIRLDERAKAMMHEEDKAMFESDAEGNTVWVNRKYQRLVGRTLEDLKGHGWVNTIHPEDREHVNEEWYRAVEEERTFVSNFRVVDPEGNVTHVNCISYVLRGPDGKPLGFLGVIKRQRDRDAKVRD